MSASWAQGKENEHKEQSKKELGDENKNKDQEKVAVAAAAAVVVVGGSGW